MGGNHWCLTPGLAVRECSRQIDKVSGFHSLCLSGGGEIFCVLIRIGYYLSLTRVTPSFLSITTEGMFKASPRGLSSAHTLGTLKGISGPFKAVSTEYYLYSSSWGVMRDKTLGSPEPKLKATCSSS
jgi:hypothetical protein